MRHPLDMVVSLTWPFMAGLIFIIAVWANVPWKLSVPVIGVGPVNVEPIIQSSVLIQMIWSIVALSGVVLFQYARDYSVFLPAHLEFKVFYDHDGIQTSLNCLSKDELVALRISEDWRAFQPSFFDDINANLQRKGVPRYASLTRETIGYGKVDYRVRKVRGLQNYQIVGGSGTVRFDVTFRSQQAQLWVVNEIVPKPTDYIHGRILDVFLRNKVLVSPKSRQEVIITPTSKYRLVDYICPTTIRFFPAVRFDRAIYCAEGQDDAGLRVIFPVSYAIFDGE